MSATSSTILVVEDDAIVRMLIVDVLEELEFMVLEAADGESALALIEDGANVIDLMAALKASLKGRGAAKPAPKKGAPKKKAG